MCGIAGIVGPAASRHHVALGRMMAALRHRGPDGQGSAAFDDCLLAHTRLSVVDVAGGRQPMLSPDGGTAVVFNGEIYGYLELRAELRREYAFRTQSDTETLLALHARDGAAMLDRLPGMFAFALWDGRRRELFCARDRFGEKPFFYATGSDGSFVFASELKAIVASGLVDVTIDPDSVVHYLRYLYVHPHRTIYRNVHVLPPAHRLLWRDGRIDAARYWKLPAPTRQIDVGEAVERFRTLLTAAVGNQMIADVPVGAFLSGGLDSSTIVALAAREHSRCKTFSFGFGPVIDELPFARGIAERYGTEHIELSDGTADLPGLLETMADVYDEPFGDSSNIPTYMLCRLARRHVTVALTGEGADELLGGYSYWYRSLYDMERARNRGAFVGALGRLIAAMCRRTGVPVPEWAGRSVGGSALSRQFQTLCARHAAQAACFDDSEISRLVPGIFPAGTPSGADRLDDILRGDLTTYLPGDILVKTDRASMAHGLELRAPFLDWEFASFCVSLPLQLKITHRADKVILRRAFADTWTDAVRRRGKQGFGAPVSEWLQRPGVRALKQEILGDSRNAVYDLVSYDAATEAAERNDYRSWALLVLALWMRSARDRRVSRGTSVAGAQQAEVSVA
jgi:asparagine synthase (glutamine-hydrolysing)